MLQIIIIISKFLHKFLAVTIWIQYSVESNDKFYVIQNYNADTKLFQVTWYILSKEPSKHHTYLDNEFLSNNV